MARIRTIKPEFWTSDQVVECSFAARLLFIGMWNFCDDYGVHPASLRKLKMEIFPGDDEMVTDRIGELINELQATGLIKEMEADGSRWWFVPGWEHQKINRVQKSSHPRPESGKVIPFTEHSLNVHGTITEHSLNVHWGRKEGRKEVGKDVCNARGAEIIPISGSTPEPCPENIHTPPNGHPVVEAFYRGMNWERGGLTADSGMFHLIDRIESASDDEAEVEEVARYYRAEAAGYTNGIKPSFKRFAERYEEIRDAGRNPITPDEADRASFDRVQAELAELER